MISVSQQRELIVEAPSATSRLGHVHRDLRGHGVQVLAASPHDDHTGARLMLVVDNPSRAQAVLAAAGLRCQVEPVLFIEAPRQIGLLAALGQQLWRKGIGICHSYVSERADNTIAAVFKTTDDRRAFELLGTSAPNPGGAAARSLHYASVKLAPRRIAA